MSGEYDPLTPDEWVKFLKDQANQTREFRHDLYEKVDLVNKRKILDIGCGTGAITADIAASASGDVIGLDIDCEKLEKARIVADPRVTFMRADAVNLPFKDNSFDLVTFSVVLLYIEDKQKAISEMTRVTEKNGIVLATMEPDHAGALFYPEDAFYPLFLQDLRKMGADLCSGRKLRYLFGNAGLRTEIGINVYDLDWNNKDNKQQLDEYLDWFWMPEKLFLKNDWTEQQIEEYKRKQIRLIENNQFFYYLPVFYAIGRKE
ncbi:MAG: methyltransferase domain-containing protein [Theionarchaea archaeon]|nr:methyltransferase domain-containing protein [Theionarchaea archaeon]